MARELRIVKSQTFYHIFTRGSRKGLLFIEEDDYLFFLNEFMNYSNKFSIIVSVFVLMSTHLHFILYLIEENLSKFLHAIFTKYAIYFNKKYENTGHVFQGRFGYKEINDENYFKVCADYIHLNPVKAKIVDVPENYKWSSCKYYFKLEEVPKNYPVDMRFLLNYYQNNTNTVFANYKNHLYNILNKEIEIEKMRQFEKDIDNLYNRRCGDPIKKEVKLKRRKEDLLYIKTFQKEEIIKYILKYFKLKDLKSNLNKKYFNIKFKRLVIYILLSLTTIKYSDLFEIIENTNKKTIYSAKKDVEIKIKNDNKIKLELDKIITYIKKKLKNIK
ncbi:MAG TPA: hypothetical protein PLD27_09630 [bacterium]|nr:hypothetical protein [bacterium]HOL48832.1 hypothetical protein [bacterium]HPQ19394.1 hypothetical protein [bacterium]